MMTPPPIPKKLKRDAKKSRNKMNLNPVLERVTDMASCFLSFGKPSFHLHEIASGHVKNCPYYKKFLWTV
jgi:hypothetical protein